MYDFAVVDGDVAGTRDPRRPAEATSGVVACAQGTGATPVASAVPSSADIWRFTPDAAREYLLQN